MEFPEQNQNLATQCIKIQNTKIHVFLVQPGIDCMPITSGLYFYSSMYCCSSKKTLKVKCMQIHIKPIQGGITRNLIFMKVCCLSKLCSSAGSTVQIQTSQSVCIADISKCQLHKVPADVHAPEKKKSRL